MSNKTSVQEKLNQIIERHCEALKRNVDDMGTLLKSVAEGAAALPGIQEAEALAHQLKGGSGTAGFHEISEAAAVLDDHLKTLLKVPETAIMAGMDTALALSDELSRIVNQAIPADSKLYSVRAEPQGKRTT